MLQKMIFEKMNTFNISLIMEERAKKKAFMRDTSDCCRYKEQPYNLFRSKLLQILCNLKEKTEQTKKTSPSFKSFVKILSERQIWVHYSKTVLYWCESVWRRQGSLGV